MRFVHNCLVRDLDVAFVYETKFFNRLRKKPFVVEVWDHNKYMSNVIIGQSACQLRCLELRVFRKHAHVQTVASCDFSLFSVILRSRPLLGGPPNAGDRSNRSRPATVGGTSPRLLKSRAPCPTKAEAPIKQPLSRLRLFKGVLRSRFMTP